MYNYDFKDEFVVYEYNNCFSVVNNKEMFVNIIITSKNLLIFYDNNSNFIEKKAMGVFISPEYELIASLSLNELKYDCKDNNTSINNNIILYNFNIKNILEEIK